MLRPIAKTFSSADYPELLVGLHTPDDAAVWRVDEGRALVFTNDFFTPVVDDPYHYGAIAAANALSDVYAMGGKPFLALNIAALPPHLPNNISTEIIRGGAEKAYEAGVVIAGGHTVQDKEPKYGLAVLGFVDPQHMITKSGSRPGDRLVLTKPIGFGVTTTALKQEKADPRDVGDAVRWMERLNAIPSVLALEAGVKSGTDVTGFSLLGHALEMAQASRVRFVLRHQDIPFVKYAHKYAEMGTFPGGAADNFNYYQDKVNFPAGMSDQEKMLLFDPQTSGGLLLAVPPDGFDQFKERARRSSQPFWAIGEAVSGEGLDVV